MGVKNNTGDPPALGSANSAVFFLTPGGFPAGRVLNFYCARGGVVPIETL